MYSHLSSGTQEVLLHSCCVLLMQHIAAAAAWTRVPALGVSPTIAMESKPEKMCSATPAHLICAFMQCLLQPNYAGIDKATPHICACACL
jgi:hypothetical protein